MRDGPEIAGLAALLGDPARANMLAALMSGMALTAGELAREAGVTAQTASAHLARLREAGLLVLAVQGRHRYYRLAGPEVAAALEALMELAMRTRRLRTRPGPRDEAMRFARVCYDHLAGTLGVRLHDACVARRLVALDARGIVLSPAGRAHFRAEGVDVEALERAGRPACRACLDWSERRHHLGGPLGAALLSLVLARKWARRDGGGRALRFSPAGLAAFERFACIGLMQAAG